MLHYKLFIPGFKGATHIPIIKANDCFLSLPIDGYAFSQEEHGVVSQSQVVRSYDTTRQRPSLEL